GPGEHPPVRTRGPPGNVGITMSRGRGEIAIAEGSPKFDGLKGGKPDTPFAGKASTTVTFKQPGDYMLHVTANDYSGNGGGGSGCCWTTAIVKVSVSGGNSNTAGAK